MRTSLAFAILMVSASLAAAAPLNDADCEAVWKLVDVDKKGSINAEQAKAYVADFVQADVDKNGSIDATEFKAACKAGLVKKKYRVRLSTAEKIDDDRPVAREVRKGDSGSSKRQGRRHNHENHSLVENDCFESCKAKQPNQQRQAKLSTAKSYQSAQGANDRTAHEGCDRLTRAAVDSLRQGSAPDWRIMASVLREVPHAGL